MPTPANQLRASVNQFREKRPLYERISEMLLENLRILSEPLAPGCEVSVRTKTVASFAGKLIRKKFKYRNPMLEMTDLSGARIVCTFESQTKAVANALRQYLGEAIDDTNSLDQRAKLRTSEFGYRSLHYVVELGPRRAGTNGIHECLWRGITPDMYGTKIEIQVRTRLQDVWSKMNHGMLYKGSQSLPESIWREVARIAAEFESLDTSLERVVAEVEEYRTHFGPFLDRERREYESDFLGAMTELDPENPELPLRQAELALSRGEWSTAIDRVRDFLSRNGPLTPALAAALGFALCQSEESKGGEGRYKEGLAHLANATTADPNLLVAWLRRAECERIPAHALVCYQHAYRLAPTDPATLCGYLHGHLAATGEAKFIDLLRPALIDGIDRCERQAALKLDLPWSHFRCGYLRLLLGQEHSDAARHDPQTTLNLNIALKALILGVATSPHLTPIREALEKIELLHSLRPTRTETRLATLLLRLLIEVRRGSSGLSARLAPYASLRPVTLPGRVVFVNGSARLAPQEDLSTYRKILGDAFAHFEGLVVSGGTESGVPGLVGELARESNGRISALAYVPDQLDPSLNATPSRGYDDLRTTPAMYFSPLEPLQAWIDLIAAGVEPTDVTMLGLGGGAIAAFEYRLALVLGARVCVFSDSGREDEFLANDPDWRDERWPLVRLQLQDLTPEKIRNALFQQSASAER